MVAELELPSGAGVDDGHPRNKETNAIAIQRDIVTSAINICRLRSTIKYVPRVRSRPRTTKNASMDFGGSTANDHLSRPRETKSDLSEKYEKCETRETRGENA